ncbi:MAG: hypothetical protein AAGA96_03200 [Verrucomicrobiota bacterium]
MKKGAFIILSLAMGWGFGFSEEFQREQDLSKLEGLPAPTLDVKDWMNTPNGQPLDLRDLIGKVVVIDFWGTW